MHRSRSKGRPSRLSGGRLAAGRAEALPGKLASDAAGAARPPPGHAHHASGDEEMTCQFVWS